MPVTKLFTQEGRAITQDGRAILCDECPCECYRTFYLDTTLPVGGDGKSWETAFNDMNTAVMNPELMQARLASVIHPNRFVCLRCRGVTTYVPGVTFEETSMVGRLKIIQDSAYDGWLIDATGADNPDSGYYQSAFSGYRGLMLEGCRIKLRKCGFGDGHDYVELTRVEQCEFEFYMQDCLKPNMHPPLLNSNLGTIRDCSIYCMTTTRRGFTVVEGFEYMFDNEINVWFNDDGATPKKENSYAEQTFIGFHPSKLCSMPVLTGNRVYFNNANINLTTSLETICIFWERTPYPFDDVIPYLENGNLMETLGNLSASSGYSPEITYRHCNYIGFWGADETARVYGPDRDQRCRYDVILGDGTPGNGCDSSAEYTCIKLVAADSLTAVLEEYAKGKK